MARSVGPSVGNKPTSSLARRGRDKGIGCPTRVFHPGPELMTPHRGRRYECSLTAVPRHAPSWPGNPPQASTAEGTVVPCRRSSGFQVGRHQRGDVAPHRRDSPATPPPSASNSPGGHATGVDSGHRPRADTVLALADVVRPPPNDLRALDGGVQIGGGQGRGRRISLPPTFGRGAALHHPLRIHDPERLAQREAARRSAYRGPAGGRFPGGAQLPGNATVSVTAGAGGPG